MMLATMLLAQTAAGRSYDLVRVAGISNAAIVANDGSVYGFDYSKGEGWPALWKNGKVVRLSFPNKRFFKNGTWSNRGPQGFDGRLCPFWADSATFIAGSCDSYDVSVARDGVLFVFDLKQLGKRDWYSRFIGGDRAGDVFALIQGFHVSPVILRLNTKTSAVDLIKTRRETLAIGVGLDGSVAELVQGKGVFVHPAGGDLRQAGKPVLGWKEVGKLGDDFHYSPDGTIAFGRGGAFRQGKRVDLKPFGYKAKEEWRASCLGADGSIAYSVWNPRDGTTRGLSNVVLCDGRRLDLREELKEMDGMCDVTSINTSGTILVRHHTMMMATEPYLLIPRAEPSACPDSGREQTGPKRCAKLRTTRMACERSLKSRLNHVSKGI